MKKLLVILVVFISRLSAQTNTSASLIGEWSTCGTWDFSTVMTFKKAPLYMTLNTCNQRPCQAISLDFEGTRVKVKSWTGCPGELSIGENDETMTWVISKDNKILTLMRGDKGTNYVILTLSSTELKIKKKQFYRRVKTMTYKISLLPSFVSNAHTLYLGEQKNERLDSNR